MALRDTKNADDAENCYDSRYDEDAKERIKQMSLHDQVLVLTIDTRAGSSGRCGHMGGMGNFILGNLPNLIGQQGDDGNGASRQRHEFHRVALAAFVNKYNCADIVPRQAMLGKSVVNTTLSSSLIMIKYPKDTLWLM